MSRRVATLMLSGVLLAGCGGSGATKTVTETSAGGSSSGAESPPETTGGSTESTPAPPPEEGKTLASRTGSVDQTKMRLELTELKRSGTTTVLTLRLTNLNEEDSTAVGSTFDDGITQRAGDEGAGSEVNTLDGIFLIDTKNSKKYLVGRDANNICVCDTDLGNTRVSANAPLLLSATYAAPPEELTAVDVFIPAFGTFKDVPLS